MACGAAAQAPPRWEDPHLRAADDYILRKDLRKAADVLQTVLDLEPGCRIETYLKLAALYLQLGDEPRARATLEQGLKAYPDSPELMKRLGQLLVRAGAPDRRTGELLARAVKANAGDAETHYLFGQWACLNNLDEVCIAELTQAAALPASGAQAKMQSYTLIAMAEDRLNHPHRAEAAFLKALDYNLALAPPNPDSLFEYVKFLVKEARDAAAQQLIARLLKLAPRYGPAHLERAKYLSQRGDLGRAAEAAELALDCAGGDRTQQRAAHVFLAKTYHALGRPEQAKAHEAAVQPR